eukprot:11179527-Lingulodinium_polyedra.AAC.1
MAKLPTRASQRNFSIIESRKSGRGSQCGRRQARKTKPRHAAPGAETNTTETTTSRAAARRKDSWRATRLP